MFVDDVSDPIRLSDPSDDDDMVEASRWAIFTFFDFGSTGFALAFPFPFARERVVCVGMIEFVFGRDSVTF